EGREVEAVEPARLHEEIGAADEVAHALEAERRDEPRELRAHRAEEPLELGDGPVELLRLEALQALLRRLGDALDLRRDADVTGVGLAAAADGAADGDHRERAEADAIGAEAEHLHHVERALHPAVAPELDVVAQAAAHERAVRLDDADLHGQAG